ncbi:MAG: DUF4905 domain-containing protein [Pedobacter sp.]|jgi:hypothetical protein
MNRDQGVLYQVISEKLDGLIWKVQINEKKTLVALESRNSDLKKVAFTVLNYQTGNIHFKEKVFEEPWNLNLAFTGEKTLVLTAFQQSNSPECRGLIAVNAQNGSKLWEQHNISLNQANENGIQVFDSRINPRKYYWIDHEDGGSIPEPGNNYSETDTLWFPQLSRPSVLPDFILREEIVGEVALLILPDKTIVSFHEKINNNFQQRLLVYQGDNILLDDILIKDIQKIQPESFFIQHNNLFYIRNKNEIVSYLV